MSDKPPLVLDIGYNVGNFTKCILSIYPDAKIIGVDGHPTYKEMFDRNPLPNVEYVHGVVSNVCKQDVSLFICDSNPGINSINPDWIEKIRHNHYFQKTKREIKVRSTTLDKMISVYGIPDIIKLDIEGAESIALSGLSQKCGIVLLEWCEEFFQDTLKCVEILRKLGYNMFSNDSHWEGTNETIHEFNPDLEYKSWDDLIKDENIEPERKKRWGMLYAK
jgi:FkbM family methyltransferase